MFRIAATVLLLLSACSDPDALATRGEACETMFSTLCTIAVDECGGSGNVTACVNESVVDCCAQAGTCNLTGTARQSDLDACAEDIEKVTCSLLWNAVEANDISTLIPPSCSTLDL